MPATNQQVQQFVDNQVRPLCAATRAFALGLEDWKASIDDIYQACVMDPPTFVDGNINAPHSVAPSDILAINAFAQDVLTYITAHNAYAIARKSCLTPLKVS